MTRRILLVALVALALPGCGSATSTPTRTITYTALGASDAVGIGAVPLSRAYVYLLEDRMRGLDNLVDLHNLGISGARVEELVASELEPAIVTDPDVVTIWTGPNDIIAGANADVFATHLDLLLRELKQNTQAIVFVANVIDLTQAPRFREDPDPDVTVARIDAFNLRIVAAVEANDCVLVDLFGIPLTDDMFFVDGFHPNNLGYERLADAFWNEIAPRL